MSDYCIERVETREQYEGLRDLWQRVFGDEPAFVDHVYRTFGAEIPDASDCDQPDAYSSPDIYGYVMQDREGGVVSALTCYRCGTMYAPDDTADDKPVYVSYAVCTDPEYRGRGLAGRLTEYVRDVVIEESGGISLVSPAEDSLKDFYADLGYRESCFASELAAETDEVWEPDVIDEEYDDVTAVDPGLSMVRADMDTYNMYREAFLMDVPHVALSRQMLELVRAESDGGDGLMVINGGDAVCVIAGYTPDNGVIESEDSGYEDSGKQGKTVFLQELLINPQLMAFSEEIGGEIAARIAGYLGADHLIYRTPGSGYCQSMSAGECGTGYYFGFPVE